MSRLNALRQAGLPADARAVLSRFLSEPLLVEMLLLPTCYYGSAIEDDSDDGFYL